MESKIVIQQVERRGDKHVYLMNPIVLNVMSAVIQEQFVGLAVAGVFSVPCLFLFSKGGWVSVYGLVVDGSISVWSQGIEWMYVMYT